MIKKAGYKGRDPISHRKTNLGSLLNRLKRTGKATYRGTGKLRGSGHRAGQAWGEQKGIDPTSRIRRYSKNSPSFDEGVMQYKMSAHAKALSNKK